jgi:hypothetical protein
MKTEKSGANKVSTTEWKQIPASWKNRIQESLKQADAGELRLNEDILKRLRKKYGLDH